MSSSLTELLRAEGAIWLDPAAEIDDIDASWQTAPRQPIYFVSWIKLGSDEQVYYNIRNRAYLETHGRPLSIRRLINRAVLLPILWIIALRSGKLERFRLILKAIRDGESGRLEGRKLTRIVDSNSVETPSGMPVPDVSLPATVQL